MLLVLLRVKIAIACTRCGRSSIVHERLLLDVDVVAGADTTHVRLAIVIQNGRRQLGKGEHECLLLRFLLLLWTFENSTPVHVLLLLVHSLCTREREMDRSCIG